MKGLRVDRLTTVVHAVKNLAVNMKILSLDTIIELMRCFPCLEKIYIESQRRKKMCAVANTGILPNVLTSV
uniref:F-box/LRR-repeat protein 15/At3g58940/PEG3-like LRR domain-containing protein n=1 Tax=Aegilops tauschii subsp. strangulata TaxID=200361 RepID=A0A453JUP5_AEGTS